MSTSFASNTTASNTFKPTMSLYIPRVYANITESFIINVFEDKIRFGKVSGVHMEKIHRTKNNYSVVIHFESWNETIVTTNFQTRIFKQGFARVVHDDPWFWIVMENNPQIVYPEKVQDAKAEAKAEAEVQDTFNPIEDQKIRSQELFELINGIVYNMKKIVNN